MKTPLYIKSICQPLLLLLLQSPFTSLSLATVSLILSILGGRAAAGPSFVIVSFILLLVVTLLITFNLGKNRFIPLILYLFSLTLLFSTTLTSDYLIGSDIHIEYYFAHLTQLEGWNPSLAYNMNASLSVTVLAPFLSNLLHIDLIWVFKIIFPMLFACVPVILYLIYRQFLSNKAAFLAAAFFAIVPTFFMETTAITRQQIATLCFVAMLYFILSKEENLPKFMRKSVWIRAPFIVVCGMLAIVSHYTTGALVMAFTGAGALITSIAKLRNMPQEIPLRVFGVSAAYIILGGLSYYAVVSGGTALHDILGLLPHGSHIQAALPQLSAEIAPPQLPPGTVIPGIGPGPVAGTPGGMVQPHSQMMQAALGLDFARASLLGQVFRVLQFLTQIGLIVGVIHFLIRVFKRQAGAIYAAMLLVSCGLLFICVIKPGFSDVINASRFYHYALIFAAPALILSAQLVSRKIPKLNTMARGYGIVFVIVVIPYMLFTTGIVFEATRPPGITRFDMPYSVALSGHRL
ncbi:MAG: DUF2206 domain-containing protein, partial [Eubacteriales bacterium]|nr:DUF2206 domain-containing protein [Eubacteriales bacterium]